MNNKLTIVWFACGILGTAIGCIRQPNKMKKFSPGFLLFVVLASIALGPLSLVAALQAEKDDPS